QGLESLASDRVQRWREHPPLVAPLVSREDQYMSEGIWHVQRRNLAWGAADMFTAVRENRILEMFYAPVLDTPSYVSRTGHRWPPEQRAEAERRAGADPRSYVSAAAPIPIYIWPRSWFWSLVAALVCGIVTACVRIERGRSSAEEPA